MKKIKYLLLSLILLSLFSCKMYKEITDPLASITLKFDYDNKELSVGEMILLNLQINKSQNSVELTWEYDSSIVDVVADNYSAVITGLKEGSTKIVASTKYTKATCFITVKDNYQVTITNPYVYVNTDYVDLKKNEVVKLSGSLFGGTQADLRGFSWTVDKPNVCSITSDNNYCYVTGLTDGMAKITCRHSKSSYPYSVLVNVSDDGTVNPYITTDNNVVMLNLSEIKTSLVTVKLKNAEESEYESLFSYSIVDVNGNPYSNAPVVITNSGGFSCSLQGERVGQCFLRVTHPHAAYPCDILINVTDNTSTAHIEPSSTIFFINSSFSELELNLVDYESEVNEHNFTWEFPENATEFIEWYTYNGNDNYSGNKIAVRGKKTGSFKVKVSYPNVLSREIAFIVRDVTTEAASVTTHISSEKNFIKLGINDEPVNFSVLLNDCTTNDINDISFTVEHYPDDNSASNVLNLSTSYGTVKKTRSVLTYNEVVNLTVTPLATGTAKIIITHPKAVYSQTIDVKVTEGNVEFAKSSYFSYSGVPIVKLKNGEETKVSVTLNGSASKSDTTWSITEGSGISILPDGLNATIVTTGTGVSKNIIEVSNPNVAIPQKITIITYDTEEELKTVDLSSIYTSSSYSRVDVDGTTTLQLKFDGYTEDPIINWDVFSGFDFVEIIDSTNTTCQVKGKTSGVASIIATSSDGKSVPFSIVVVDSRIIETSLPCYLSTNQTVFYFSSENETKEFSISLFNLTETAADDLIYECTSEDYEIVHNNNYFTVTSLKAEAKGELTISHPLSENTLTIQLHTGEKYEYKNQEIYIVNTSVDSIVLNPEDSNTALYATVKNEDSIDSNITSGFIFTNNNIDIISITPFATSNVCYINPIKAGVATITVSHPEADITKEVLVVVQNEPSTVDFPYLTTSENEVYVVQGEYQTVTVELKNSTNMNSTWNWESSDPNIAKVVSNTGNTVLVAGQNPGTVKISCNNSDCINNLEIFVTVLDSTVIETRPYIHVSEDIYTIKKGEAFNLLASMIGGSGNDDNNYFSFSCSNDYVCLITSSQNTCYVKAQNKGLAYITIKNSKYNSSYSKTILVIVEDTYESDVKIEVPEKVIKLKPYDNRKEVKATLVNGQPTDAKDFIWWVDDYNLLSIDSITDSCVIAPTGKTGTTVLHVKHPKAEKVVDIVCFISNYDNFSFGTNFSKIEPEKLYFFPLQIPQTSEYFTVEYESNNEELCVISGSNEIAVVCASEPGQAILTANMVSTVDKSIIASTELVVDILYPDVTLPTLDLGQSMITVEEGTSKIFSVILSNTDENDKYNLKWEIKNGDINEIYFDHQSDKTSVFYGPESYVTFNNPGQYILSVTHEASGVYADMYIVVEKSGEVGIELETDIIIMSKEDGTASITANLINSIDYSQIEWSAVKANGQNIVSVSKTKGQTCTIVPREQGQTTVIARLPNGNYATCTVIVTASKTLTIDHGQVHVIPGYTTVVKYKAEPAGSTVRWIQQDADDTNPYFSYQDDLQGNLYITGLSDYPYGEAGTLTGYIVGASSAKMPELKVFVEYNIELEIKDTISGSRKTAISTNNPDSSNLQSFDIVYFPTDLEIDITFGGASSSDFVEIANSQETTFMENGTEKMKRTVTLMPTGEGETTINVTATLPSSKGAPLDKASKTADLSYYGCYDTYSIIPNFTGGEGAFSKYENGRLYIADGEEVLFNFKIAEENATGSITSVEWERKNPETEFECLPYTTFSDRNSLRNYFFGNITSSEAMNSTPTKGLLFLKTESNSNNETVYRFGHMYDYYVDVNMPTGDPEKYCKTFFEENEYFMITGNLGFTYNGKDYFAIPDTDKEPLGTVNVYYNNEDKYEDKNTFAENLSDETDDHEYWNVFSRSLGTRFSGLSISTSLSSRQESVSWDSNFDWTKVDPRFFYWKCIPYVVSKEEIFENEWFYNPNGTVVETLKWEKKCDLQDEPEWYPGENKHIETCSYTNENFNDRYTEIQEYPLRYNLNYIQPTTYKGKDKARAGVFIGNIIVTTSKEGQKPYTIPVYYDEYKCESYTSDNWKNKNYNGKVRYYYN